MISNGTMLVLVCMVLIGILAPVLLAVIWKVKTREPFSTILIGAVIFFVFAILLETLPKLVLFQDNNPIGAAVMSNTWLYMAIAALLAGIFEETGRLVAFRFLLKNRKEKKTAISYGIGHGGFEVIWILGLGGIQYLVYAVMINSGQFDTLVSQAAASSPAQLEALKAIPAALEQMTILPLFLSVLERVSAVLIHISCSLIMFMSVREKGKIWLYPLAILLHASIDLLAAGYLTGLIKNYFLVEGILLVWAVALFFVCMKYVYRKMPE